MTAPSNSEQNVSCQFETPYICGYDTISYYNIGGVWTRRQDAGFRMQDDTVAKGNFLLSHMCDYVVYGVYQNNYVKRPNRKRPHYMKNH